MVEINDAAAAAIKTKTHTIYQDKAGKRLPSVTTILRVIDKGEGLLVWANQLGQQGINHRDYRDELADVGTLAHAMIAESLGGEMWDRDMYTPNQISSAQNAVRAFFNWEKLQLPIETKMLEKPLISERFKFGGTIDWYGTIGDVPCLMDFKTSKGLYNEHEYQVSAYYQLLTENGFPVDEIRVLRVGRTPEEGFEDRRLTIGQVRGGLDVFLSALELYKAVNRYNKSWKKRY